MGRIVCSDSSEGKFVKRRSLHIKSCSICLPVRPGGHDNPCSGKWKLVEDITKYEHSSAGYYITGKHADYVVTDIEAPFSGRYVAGELSKIKLEEKFVDGNGQMSS